MGQYHILYNIDKKEFVHGHHIDNGLKLMEQCGWPRSTATALWLLVANSNGRGGGDALKHEMVGRWAGDRIVVQGDYAEPNDTAYLTEKDIESFTEISSKVSDMLNKEFER